MPLLGSSPPPYAGTAQVRPAGFFGALTGLLGGSPRPAYAEPKAACPALPPPDGSSEPVILPVKAGRLLITIVIEELGEPDAPDSGTSTTPD